MHKQQSHQHSTCKKLQQKLLSDIIKMARGTLLVMDRQALNSPHFLSSLLGILLTEDPLLLYQEAEIHCKKVPSMNHHQIQVQVLWNPFRDVKLQYAPEYKRSEVFTVVKILAVVFWVMIPLSLVGQKQHFRAAKIPSRKEAISSREETRIFLTTQCLNHFRLFYWSP